MFQFFSEIGFNIVKPAILMYMKKKNYPQEAVIRKNALFEEGFSKEDINQRIIFETVKAAHQTLDV